MRERGADALDGGHLVLHRQDRLHPQRRADPGAGRADAPAAPEELERVDPEPKPQLLARVGHVLGGLLRARAVACCLRRRQHHEAEPAGRRGRVDHLDALAALAVAGERLLRLARSLGRAREPPGDVYGHHLAAVGQKRLEHRREVTHGGLRGGGQRLGAAELLEERRVVGDVHLRHGAVAAENHVQGHDVNAVTLDQLRR